MKRLITLLLVSFFACTSVWANEEYDITFEKRDTEEKLIELGYGILSLRLVENGNNYRVIFSIENITTSEAILLFKNSQDEKTLKKGKLKIEFEKTYPGSKGKRNVFGCRELNVPLVAITAQEKLNIFSIDVQLKSATKLELPIYLAKYDPKKLVKKGAYKIDYKILSEDILSFNIDIKGWSENDPDYLSTKSAVEEYIRSVNVAAFCNNKKHPQSLEEQMRPYQERRDSLINVITRTIEENSDWLSLDTPHKKYTELLNMLNSVNLKEHTYDCGQHKPEPGRHKCRHCNLSAQQIYHKLDDIYQQLRNNKITKDIAVKNARELYVCYQKNAKRKKDASYSEKISRFYSRITNY